MTEKRYVLFNRKDTDYILDNPNTSLDFIEMLGDALSSEEIVDRLNEQDKTIKELNKYCTACDDTLTTIQELTYKLLTIDFGNAESKADYCRLLNELDNKDLSFIHDCIEAINKCDLMKMEELKREYGDDVEINGDAVDKCYNELKEKDLIK